MSAQEFVEHFVKNFRKKLIKFLFSMITVDVVLLSIFIYLLFNVVNEKYSSYAAYIMAAVIMINTYINIRIHFGSYKGYINGDQLTRFYKRKKKKFEKVQKNINVEK